MEEWWKDVFLGSGTAGTDGEDGESTRLFEEPHSSSSVGHEWFSVRDGAVDPSIQWCANKQKGCRQMIQSLFQKALAASSMEKDGMEERRAVKRKALFTDFY